MTRSDLSDCVSLLTVFTVFSKDPTMRKKRRKKQQTKVRRAALELLRDPKFLFRVVQQIGTEGVVGESQNRLMLFLACLTSALKNVVSILVKGASSTGKNNLTKSVLSLIPPELVLTRSSLTKTALAYGSDELAGKILYLAEYRGGRDAQFFTRLLQSEGALQHEATTISGAKRETTVAIRAGAPVILTTTTDESVYVDDETRFLSLRADESSELTREVVRTQFGPEQGGTEPVTELPVWHEAFRLLCEQVPKFRKPEWFSYLGEHIPADNPRARRDVPRFLSLLQAVALCRSFSDGRMEEAKRKEIEINFGDYCVAFRILGVAFESTYAGVHPTALEFAKAVRHLCRQSKLPVTTKDVAEHLGWNGPVAHKWRVEALKQKLIRYKPGTHPSNKKPLLPSSLEHATAFLPAPGLVFRERPELGNVVRYVDPITGQKRVWRRRNEETDEG
jgi:hypothetical protein